MLFDGSVHQLPDTDPGETQEWLDSLDAVVIATDHDAFDYKTLQRHAKLVIDTRGRYLLPTSNVVKA